MPSKRDARTRQQTLTQIDFVRHLTPEDDLELDLEVPEPKRRRTAHMERRTAPQDGQRVHKTTGSRGTEHTTPVTGTDSLYTPPPSRLSRSVKHEIGSAARTLRSRARKSIPSLSGSLSQELQGPPEHIRSPLEETSINRGSRSVRALASKANDAAIPKAEQEGEPTHIKGPKIANKRNTRTPKKVARDSSRPQARPHARSSGESTSGSRRIAATKTEVQDSEDSSTESDDGQMENEHSYRYGKETQAIIQSMRLNSKELDYQRELLQPDQKTKTPALGTEAVAKKPPSSRKLRRGRPRIPSEELLEQQLRSEQHEHPELASSPPPDRPASSSSLDKPENNSSPKSSQKESRPPQPEKTFSQATTTDITQSSPRSSSNIASQSFRFSIPKPPTQSLSSNSDEIDGSHAIDWARSSDTTRSQLLSDSLLESIPPPPPFMHDSEDEP